jgi:DNA-binding Xre family transcriptional regulator
MPVHALKDVAVLSPVVGTTNGGFVAELVADEETSPHEDRQSVRLIVTRLLNHAMRRRSINVEKKAQQIGISRPQLCNLMDEQQPHKNIDVADLAIIGFEVAREVFEGLFPSYIVVERPKPGDSDSAFKDLWAIVSSKAKFVSQYDDAIKDGVITRQEQVAIRDALEELGRAVATFALRVKP